MSAAKTSDACNTHYITDSEINLFATYMSAFDIYNQAYISGKFHIKKKKRKGPGEWRAESSRHCHPEGDDFPSSKKLRIFHLFIHPYILSTLLRNDWIPSPP
ncbi:hypothetical protein CDAR_308261 [Caerostris darwini]|uniref:Uncharacterized protein n=1 Tax=Caerostris darwini TaxID=1538125 RepID=A0AAV4S7H2_9ARAC|nr:hypothetical protein CDAR_308261 [Caerostris darwini]